MTKKDISKYYVDENVVRLIAAQVIIILLLVFFNHRTYLIIILTADFALRAFTYLPSPLAAVAKVIAVLFKLKSKPIIAAPKKFAAGIGFIFSTAIFNLLYFKLLTAAYTVGGILIFFALLESVFKVCVGCYIYNRIVAPIINKRNNKTGNQ